MSRTAITITWVIFALAGPATTITAQAVTRTDPQLDRVDSLVRDGRLADARSALDAWNAAHPATDITSGNIRARALLLRARLATSWDGAEEALRAVALGYPVSSHAPEALLMLGQGLIASAAIQPASNAVTRATGYLERLVTEYPATHLRGPALLWLARAYRLGGRVPLACARLDDALALDLTIETRQLVLEERQACTARESFSSTQRLSANIPVPSTAARDVRDAAGTTPYDLVQRRKASANARLSRSFTSLVRPTVCP